MLLRTAEFLAHPSFDQVTKKMMIVFMIMIFMMMIVFIMIVFVIIVIFIMIQLTLYKCTSLGTRYKSAFKEGVYL